MMISAHGMRPCSALMRAHAMINYERGACQNDSRRRLLLIQFHPHDYLHIIYAGDYGAAGAFDISLDRFCSTPLNTARDAILMNSSLHAGATGIAFRICLLSRATPRDRRGLIPYCRFARARWLKREMQHIAWHARRAAAAHARKIMPRGLQFYYQAAASRA